MRTPKFKQIYNRFIPWSLKTFKHATAYSSLQKLKTEIKETEMDLMNGERPDMEYADMLLCVIDSSARAGVSFEDLMFALDAKVDINVIRKWKENSDKTYSHI